MGLADEAGFPSFTCKMFPPVRIRPIYKLSYLMNFLLARPVVATDVDFLIEAGELFNFLYHCDGPVVRDASWLHFDADADTLGANPVDTLLEWINPIIQVGLGDVK